MRFEFLGSIRSWLLLGLLVMLLLLLDLSGRQATRMSWLNDSAILC